MPLFTADNAKANALKSAQVRREKRERLRNPPPPPLPAPQMPDDLARNARVMKQLDKCDEFLEQCKDGETFVKLTGAKERLWNLIYPKAGVIRQRPQRQPGYSGAAIKPLQPLSI
jgi:hypothetical protein